MKTPAKTARAAEPNPARRACSRSCRRTRQSTAAKKTTISHNVDNPDTVNLQNRFDPAKSAAESHATLKSNNRRATQNNRTTAKKNKTWLKTAIQRSGAKNQYWLGTKSKGKTAINPANKTG